MQAELEAMVVEDTQNEGLGVFDYRLGGSGSPPPCQLCGYQPISNFYPYGFSGLEEGMGAMRPGKNWGGCRVSRSGKKICN